MKETRYVCPVCGSNLYWIDNTSGEVTDPAAAFGDEGMKVRESLELRCRACWAAVSIPESLFNDEVMVIGE